jgi:hypothetical protein
MPKKKRELPRVERIQPEALAKELEGLCDAGMKEEALRLAEAILQKKRLMPDELFQVVRTIGVHSNFTKWKTKIRAAYGRQSRRFRRNMRPEMLAMYASNEQWQCAAEFLSLHGRSTAAEMLFSMDVLLALERFDDAARLGMRCIKTLCRPIDAFDQSLLVTAVGEYFCQMQMWDEALENWKYMPLGQPFRRDALSGIVKAHLALALESARRGLQLLSNLKQSPNYELHVALPYNDEEMTGEAERELLKFKRGIEKLLPTEKRKEFGAIATTQENQSSEC